MRRLPRQGLLLLAIVAAGCLGADTVDEPRWTEPEATAITTIRGMRVRAVRCRGLGPHELRDNRNTFARFDCLAQTRAPFQRYDTVTVLYVLHPLDEYEGRRRPHRLTNVRFVGGPGIP
jgi:hypothetical protein